MIHFDHNATTPVAASALETFLEATRKSWHNPSGPCRNSARVRNLLEAARARAADLLGCAPERVVFNSGATEGVNAIIAHGARLAAQSDLPLLHSPVEHPCVTEAAAWHAPGRVMIAETDANGTVRLDSLENALAEKRPVMVSIMAANNETGAFQPWREIASLCRRAGVPYHCDAAQWIGKLPAAGLAASDFLTVSAHKFGGPKGVGLLVLPEEPGAFRSLVGGAQENGRRAGTENYPAAAALVTALEAAERMAAEGVESRLRWRQRFENELEKRLPGLRVAAAEADRLWNTTRLILPRGDQTRWLRKLDRRGFCVSTGSACATGSEKLSPVLAALGFAEDEIRRGLRISSGWETTETDWQTLFAALLEVEEEIDGDSEGPGEVITV